MNNDFLRHLEQKLSDIKDGGFYKAERVITTAQQALISVQNKGEVLNLCANNYLGLADNKEIITSAKDALDNYGFGMASVRFICGTQITHKELELRLSSFLNMEDTILYSSCFDANGGLFETLFDQEDAILSDSLNHASIIDGIRLCKAKRYRYENNDMQDLESKLKESMNARFRVIATDGVFSMDGIISNLKGITELAAKYNALVMVDDCHAVGFLGKNGRGTPEYCDVEGKIDILTGTLGKALGGASGGYISGKAQIIEILRQRSRPYLFSNALAPPITVAGIKVLDLLENSHSLRENLENNSAYFRKGLTSLGFTLIPGSHPIIPIMLFEEKLSLEFAKEMLEKGVYVTNFCYPVVPTAKARIRTQMSAAFSKQDLDFALDAFYQVGKKLKVIN